MSVRAISLGGGRQSTALVVLWAQGKLEADVAIFANVGDDSEDPLTLAYMDEHLRPYMERHGLELCIVNRKKRDGSEPTLYGEIVDSNGRNQKVPVRLNNGAPGTRSCTVDFKIRPINREMKKRGATAENPGVSMIGFAIEEFHRMKPSPVPYIRAEFPLVDMRISTEACKQIVADAGLPVPPRSSCWFCPFQRPTRWLQLYRERPELFDEACRMEDLMGDYSDSFPGRGRVYMTRYARPLREVIAELDRQGDLFGADDDEGHCTGGASCFT